MFKLFSVCLIFLVSCSNSNCDCSYVAFKKLKHRMNIEQVEKILKSKPNKAVQIGECWQYSFLCNDKTINVMLTDGFLSDYSFNTELGRSCEIKM